MTHVLALDQGTTSSRAIVFDHAGTVCGVAQQEFPQLFPQPGWVEHDPEAIWESQRQVARRVLAETGLGARDIAAVGLTNQRETTVLWERKTGRALHNAIVWQDRRTAGLCDALRAAGHAELFLHKTGLVVDAYLAGTKLSWLLDHIPGARRRAEAGELAFGTVDSWLLWKLSGGTLHATDATNASRTLFYDIHRQDWDDELLALLDIPRALLPEVRDSSGHFCATTALVDGAELPVCGVAGDQHAALFGQACTRPGMAKNTYGTGCFLLMNTGESAPDSRHRLLATTAWRLNGAPRYALEGSVFIGGAVVQWLRDGLGLIRHAAEVEALAASVTDSSGVRFVPAFTGLGAPHWDAYARGTVTGLTRGSTAGHLARAALEAIALQSCDLVDAMQADTRLAVAELRVDGGATANALLMQIQADLLGIPVVRPRITETTALGAAALAGLAVGYWRSADDFARTWQSERVFNPQWSSDRAQTLRHDWARALDRARGWIDPDASGLKA